MAFTCNHSPIVLWFGPLAYQEFSFEGLNMEHLSIGQAALMIGVCITTLRNWEKSGMFLPAFRTLGNHRRYAFQAIEAFIKGPDYEESSNRETYAYARVSSSDQKMDLERQKNRLIEYCEENLQTPTVLSDIGSGLNCKKPGLKKLIQAICLGKINSLVIVNEDRLLRFGMPIIFQLCRFHGTDIIVLESMPEQSFEDELVNDVITLMTVFTSRLYGKRSHRNRKAKKKAA